MPAMYAGVVSAARLPPSSAFQFDETPVDAVGDGVNAAGVERDAAMCDIRAAALDVGIAGGVPTTSEPTAPGSLLVAGGAAVGDDRDSR